MHASSAPIISIICNTYNHSRFIRTALEGFLMQKCTYPIEVLIHDDASTDGTQDIIRNYEREYPTLILPIYQKENMYSKGIKPTQRFQRPRAKGKYLAICEGDDYWTDPLKLQKQVDFLEAHPEYVICYHNAIVVDENDVLISPSKLPLNEQRDFSSIELKKGRCFILTMSCVFRNVPFKACPEASNILNGDKFAQSRLGAFGKGKYLPTIEPAVYREHSGGVWSRLSAAEKLRALSHTHFMLAEYHKRLKQQKYARYFSRSSARLRKSVLLVQERKHQGKPIRVAMLQMLPQSVFNGNPFGIAQIAQGLREKGYTVSLFTMCETKGSSSKEYTYNCFQTQFQLLRLLRKHLRSQAYDIIFIDSIYLPCRIALNLRERFSIPIVFQTSPGENKSENSILLKKSLQRMNEMLYPLNPLDAVVVNNDTEANIYKLLIQSRLLKYIRTPQILSAGNNPLHKSQSFKHKSHDLTTSTGNEVALIVGSGRPDKITAKLIVRALNAVKEVKPHLHTFYINLTQEKTPLLDKLIEKFQLQNHLFCIRKPEISELRELCDQASLYIALPHDQETSDIAFQMVSRGIAGIGFDSVVRTSRYHYYHSVPYGDFSEFAKTIVALCDDNKLQRETVEKAQLALEQELSLDARVVSYGELFRDTINKYWSSKRYYPFSMKMAKLFILQIEYVRLAVEDTFYTVRRKLTDKYAK